MKLIVLAHTNIFNWQKHGIFSNIYYLYDISYNRCWKKYLDITIFLLKFLKFLLLEQTLPKELDYIFSKFIKERIVFKFIDHESYRCITSTLNVPVSTVGFILKKWKKSDITENSSNSCGTPQNISERNRRQMMRTVRNDPFVTRQELYRLTSAEMGQAFAKERSIMNSKDKIESLAALVRLPYWRRHT